MQIINPEFSVLNQKRSEQYPKSEEFTTEYFALALSEEVGEFCGALKKLKRGFNDREALKINADYEKYLKQVNHPITAQEFWLNKQRGKLASELADILIYLDLTFNSLNLDTNTVITDKFNQVSEEMKINITLP